MERNVIRQGDLLFIPCESDVDSLPADLKRVENGVIAYGEATGHHHKLALLDAAEVFEGYDGMTVRVGPNGVSIVHEEHGTVNLQPRTTYKVNRAREFDYLANLARNVAD